jgi:hypothetical protein
MKELLLFGKYHESWKKNLIFFGRIYLKINRILKSLIIAPLKERHFGWTLKFYLRFEFKSTIVAYSKIQMISEH